MDRKRQRFDIYPGVRFTCDRTTARGARPLRIGRVDLGPADCGLNRVNNSAKRGRTHVNAHAQLGGADSSRNRAGSTAELGRANRNRADQPLRPSESIWRRLQSRANC